MRIINNMEFKQKLLCFKIFLTLIVFCCWSNIGLSTRYVRVEEGSEEDKIAMRIAREIVMVDENNNSLKDQYETVIRTAFSKDEISLLSTDRRDDIPKPKKDVLILGAGIAGLLAGKILQSRGYQVTILEANGNRIGGRLKTFHNTATDINNPFSIYMNKSDSPFLDKDLYAEAGAMRIPSSHPLVMTLIDVLHLEHSLFIM